MVVDEDVILSNIILCTAAEAQHKYVFQRYFQTRSAPRPGTGNDHISVFRPSIHSLTNLNTDKYVCHSSAIRVQHCQCCMSDDKGMSYLKRNEQVHAKS
ncbi:hypothetical protein SCLCIDRAFT_250575 [Scleroderma citrinum Foug A]|uniref:Uncharacterized protein n=1 Tax=Scleroderma citrinum Foug A TaxID=1036808 RepID=A0A0C2Z2U9_9AGAM|nr:hypothetical protein SCLCIDRAFT_250575 [Scleroderma citrinum Foug A]